MKLDVNALRYLTKDEFRVLTAVEMGMKNHEIVPAELVDRIAGLKHGGAYKNMKTLLRHKLTHHDSSKYDGFRLTNLGYDYLAIRTMVSRGLISGVGRQIGVGKESDIFEVITPEGETMALKLHRLGRTSFRAVKTKRDYLKHRNSYSWLYLSRLAALKEYAFMKALGEHGFPVPRAVDWNRHCVLMTLVKGFPMVQVKQLSSPSKAFETVLGLITRLAQHGLIHCDFNEFNLMVDDDENITMIDFPQMVSITHRNAEMYFDRDVECIFKFFGKRFNYSPPGIKVSKAVSDAETVVGDDEEDDGRPDFEAVAGGQESLDKVLEASGFSRKDQETLEQFIESAEGDEELSEDDELSNDEDTSEQLPTGNVDSGSHAPESFEMLTLDEGVKPLPFLSAENAETVPEESDESQSGKEEDPKLLKRLEKTRNRAAAHVKTGGRSRNSRNASKEKGGRRSKNVSSSSGYEIY